MFPGLMLLQIAFPELLCLVYENVCFLTLIFWVQKEAQTFIGLEFLSSLTKDFI